MELDECADQMTGAAITGDCAKGTTHGLGADPKVEEVFGLLEREGSKDYDDYEKDTVTQLEHALQAAHLASQSGAEESTIVAALLHDIGQLLPHSESKKHINGQSIGRTSHATIGENYLLDLGFPKVVAELVGSHVLAKRYLVATDQGYLAGLAFTSGGPMSPAEVVEFEKDPLYMKKAQIRKWDDSAKDPGRSALVPPLSHYKPMVYRVCQA